MDYSSLSDAYIPRNCGGWCRDLLVVLDGSIYYMEVFARSAAFLTPELIRARFNWRLNAALPRHRTRNSFASRVEKSSFELPLTKIAGQADAAVVRLQRTPGLGTRRGAAGRGRPPQAAARRAGLEDRREGAPSGRPLS